MVKVTGRYDDMITSSAASTSTRPIESVLMEVGRTEQKPLFQIIVDRKGALDDSSQCRR
jgi:phenylacetate-coenzyme A ligase PaaK-like adenylate-forming protein